MLFKIILDSYFLWISVWFLQFLLTVKVLGSFRLEFIIQNLHWKFNFIIKKNKTAIGLLSDSCGTAFISQGILLHYNTHDNADIYQNLYQKIWIFGFYICSIDHWSNNIHFLLKFALFYVFAKQLPYFIWYQHKIWSYSCFIFFRSYNKNLPNSWFFFNIYTITRLMLIHLFWIKYEIKKKCPVFN